MGIASILQILERNIDKRLLVILDPYYGFEGRLTALSSEPLGIWLSNAKAVTLRSTIAQPIPQIVSREDKSEIFINLNSVHRIEVLKENKN